MRFTTKSGSVYAVDAANKRIARLTGNTLPTERVGDAEWKTYSEIYAADGGKIAVGQRVVIVWGDDVPVLNKDTEGLVVKLTTTSPVVSIDEDYN